MSFSENAIISIRNNARLRRERTFLNTESVGDYVATKDISLTKAEQMKLAKAANKRDRAIYLYYFVMSVLAAIIVGYIVAFQW